MDPTKNFDHLDPKLKETYARVMGTSAGGAGNPMQNPAVQATATPVNQPAALPNQNMGPNPGTGPTINSVPEGTSATISPMQQAQPAQTMNTPAPSSFFSNPSPANTEPTQTPISPGNYNQNAPVTPAAELNQAPVIPYSPDAQTQNPPIPTEQMGQPLPSPAAIAQKAPHETSALLRVLYIVGGVIFFAIYTVFWIKVFNLPFFF